MTNGMPSYPGRALVIVAHPDDEVIFFFGTIKRLVEAEYAVSVLCATGRFDNGRITSRRVSEFKKSCELLDVDGHLLGMLDRRGETLPASDLRKHLQSFANDPSVTVVYTHNPWGDYGHLHHSSVSIATHEVFKDKVLCLSGPLIAEERHTLSSENYKQKVAHMRTIYSSQEFAWPWCSRTESFSRVRLQHAEFLARLAQRRVRSGDSRLSLINRADYSQDIFQIAHTIALGFSQSSKEVPAELEHIPYRVWNQPIRRFWRRLIRTTGITCDSFIKPTTV